MHNHFSDEVIDKGFPDHISSSGKAYYADGSVIPSPAPESVAAPVINDGELQVIAFEVARDVNETNFNGAVAVLRGLVARVPSAPVDEVSATSAIPVSDGWQDIATAPKDESRILVYFGERLGVREVQWTCLWSDDLEKDGSWHVDDNKHGPYPLRGYSDGDDTGWMPLPVPPVSTHPENDCKTTTERATVPSLSSTDS